MKKNKNPYNQILDVMAGVSKRYNNPAMGIGKVLEPPPNIKVAYNGIILEKEEVYINPFLLIGYRRTAKGTIKSATQNRAGGGGYAEYASHNHDINNPYSDDINTTDTLQTGEYVTIMPMPASTDGTSQQYAILTQLVHL